MALESIYIDPTFSRDVAFLMQHSPDLALDLGVLNFICACRNWKAKSNSHGVFVPEGWTQLPIKWFAEKSGMGQTRVRESLERLKRWGIILEKAREYETQQRLFFYQKGHRPPALPKEEASPEQFAERPPLLSGRDGMFGIAYIWDGSGNWHMEEVKVGSLEYSQFPMCQSCKRVIHPSEGMFKNSPYCIECRTAIILEEDNFEPVELTHNGKKLTLSTEEEVKEWFNDTMYAKEMKEW